MNQNRAKRRRPRPATPACPLCPLALATEIRRLRAEVADLWAQVDAIAGIPSSSVDEAVEQALAELSAEWGIDL